MFGQVSETATSTNYPEGMSMQHVGNDDLKFRRHRRMRELPELTYEFTKEPDLLHQYYVLRSIHLSRTLPTVVPIEPDQYDLRSEIMVIRKKRQVVGGARIIVRRTSDTPPLYIERGGFLMEEALPELAVNLYPYCEISKLYLLDEFQNMETVKQMYRCVVEKFNEMGMRYGFATSSVPAARIHRRSLKGSGANYTLLNHVKVPVDGPERADNRSFQVLSLFDTMEQASPEKLLLLERMSGVELIEKKVNSQLESA